MFYILVGLAGVCLSHFSLCFPTNWNLIFDTPSSYPPFVLGVILGLIWSGAVEEETARVLFRFKGNSPGLKLSLKKLTWSHGEPAPLACAWLRSKIEWCPKGPPAANTSLESVTQIVLGGHLPFFIRLFPRYIIPPYLGSYIPRPLRACAESWIHYVFFLYVHAYSEV